MKQTILAVVRPNLNLAIRENQLAHLAEHLLFTPERQQLIGLDRHIPNSVIFSQGYITELYCVEYYVVIGEEVDKVAEIIQNNQSELGASEEVFQSAKGVLTQELRENKSTELSLAEQYERSIYTDDSPAVRHPWFDGSKLAGAQLKDVVSVFNEYSEPARVISLSYDRYDFGAESSGPRNTIRQGSKKIELVHPDQKDGLVEVNILIPIESPVNDPALLDIYLHSLADFHLGVLGKELRDKAGYVYWVEAYWNLFANCVQIRFSTSQANRDKAVSMVNDCLANYQSKVSGRFQDFAFQAKLKRELDWGRINDYSLRYIEEAILGGVTKSPREIAAQIDELTLHDLVRFNDDIYSRFQEKGLIVFTRHGEKLETKHTPR